MTGDEKKNLKAREWYRKYYAAHREQEKERSHRNYQKMKELHLDLLRMKQNHYRIYGTYKIEGLEDEK